MDQVDGFYLATFDDAGIANIEFTPFVEEVKIVAAPASEYLADTGTIRKRADTSCQGHSFNVTALDWAKKELQRKAIANGTTRVNGAGCKSLYMT
jgi:hypothetical protein